MATVCVDLNGDSPKVQRGKANPQHAFVIRGSS